MGVIRIFKSSPPGVASVQETRIACTCGWTEKSGSQLKARATGLAEVHNERFHKKSFVIHDERP